MPFNGSGTFTVVNTFVPNTTILSSSVNANFTDIATGLSDALTRDGQAGMTAALKAIGGALGAPGIMFTSDATSGLYLNTTGVPGLVAKSLGILLNSSIYQVSSAAVQSGGSGYAVGDTITLTGGTAINQAVLTVATLSGSAVATVTVTYPGNYTAKPSDPVAQGSTSGAGSGATFNITWTTQFTRSVVTDEASAPVWQRLGSSSFVSGLMAKANGLDFATGIGSANLAGAVASSLIIPPQGILSPVSSTASPIPASDQTAVTRIYWTPYNGNYCPIYNGVAIVNTTSGQLFCDLTAGAQVLGGIYDVYKFINAGVVTLGFSPSWLAGTSGSVTAGSCARGTGAGGAALDIVSGIRVNAAAMTVNNGATTYSVAANQGTYLGSIYVNAVAGQINCHVSFGQSRVWGLWNSYNRQNLNLTMGDSTASWTYATATFRQSRATATNVATSFCGLPEEPVSAVFRQSIDSLHETASNLNFIGVGINSTTTPTGLNGRTGDSQDNITASTSSNMGIAQTTLAPALGINNFNSLEKGSGPQTTFIGTSAGMAFVLSWRG